MKTLQDFKEAGMYNFLLNCERFKISWNPYEDETAICVDGSYYILMGDHREKYLEIINSTNALEDCLKYFKDNQYCVSFWSNKLD